MNSDARLTRLRYEAELLEADPLEGAPSEEVVRPSAPWMAKLQQDISGLSIEEKVERLEEVYVDLDALVRIFIWKTFASSRLRKRGDLFGFSHQA